MNSLFVVAADRLRTNIARLLPTVILLCYWCTCHFTAKLPNCCLCGVKGADFSWSFFQSNSCSDNRLRI